MSDFNSPSLNKRIECIAEQCNAYWHNECPPFCSSCWFQQYPTEELRKMDKVYVIQEVKDFRVITSTAKDTELGAYVLIESEIANILAEVFIQKSKAVQQTALMLGAATVTLGGIAAFAVTKGRNVNTSGIQEFGKNINLGALKNQLSTRRGTSLGSVGLPERDAIEKNTFQGLSESNDMTYEEGYIAVVNILHAAGYRVKTHHDQYLVLKRQRNKLERIKKDMKAIGNFTESLTKNLGQQIRKPGKS
jgi:hypothetical protein